MTTPANFRPYNPDQPLLLPPDPREWLREGDLVYFILDMVRALDLSKIRCVYSGEKGGQPPYDPEMMTALLLYAYCMGVFSSRKIEQATYDSVAFRVLTADQHPDHDTISTFRKQHLAVLSGLFNEVLRLCRKAGLVKLGHVALDGTKVRANASKHKAMSYGRMEQREAELVEQVGELLAQAEATDATEDALYGKGKRAEELPKELRFKESRLAKIREAKRALEEEARAAAVAQQAEYEAKVKAREERGGRGREPKPPSEKPAPKAQRNFTDPDSRIMKDGATKSFEQSYNCQAAVDATAQVIVACAVTQKCNDKEQVAPMVEAMKANLDDTKPKTLTADAGYFSETNVETLTAEKIDAYVATGRQKHGEAPPPPPRGRIPKSATVQERMVRKLRTIKGRATYSKRKQIVEPVFGQIKEARRFRRFSFRGLVNVAHEWALVCLTHNLLKLFRGHWRPAVA
jgi:transposase